MKASGRRLCSFTMTPIRFNPCRVQTWAEAEKRNFALCKPLQETLTVGERGKIKGWVDFIKEQQAQRYLPATVHAWRGVTLYVSDHPKHYDYRDPDGVFSQKYSEIFAGRRVLDIGCRVVNPEHALYRHYRNMGAKAIGIDLLLEKDDPTEGIYQGDARMLAFPEAAFDFIDVPWLFGFGNPSNTILEVVAGFSELYRVLDNGLVHIANGSVRLAVGISPSPALVYIANLLQFGFYCLDKEKDGIPKGYYLVKKDKPMKQNPFRDIFCQLEEYEVNLSRYKEAGRRSEDRIFFVWFMGDIGIDRHNCGEILSQLFINPDDSCLQLKIENDEPDVLLGHLDDFVTRKIITFEQAEKLAKLFCFL